MRTILFILLLMCTCPNCASGQSPYNPDSNQDGLINVTDVMSVLGWFGQPFDANNNVIAYVSELATLGLADLSQTIWNISGQHPILKVPSGVDVVLNDLFYQPAQTIISNEDTIYVPEDNGGFYLLYADPSETRELYFETNCTGCWMVEDTLHMAGSINTGGPEWNVLGHAVYLGNKWLRVD